jgi:hypothetical protein
MNFSVGVNMYSENVTCNRQASKWKLAKGLTSYWYLFRCSQRNVEANIVIAHQADTWDCESTKRPIQLDGCKPRSVKRGWKEGQ